MVDRINFVSSFCWPVFVTQISIGPRFESRTKSFNRDNEQTSVFTAYQAEITLRAQGQARRPQLGVLKPGQPLHFEVYELTAWITIRVDRRCSRTGLLGLGQQDRGQKGPGVGRVRARSFAGFSQACCGKDDESAARARGERDDLTTLGSSRRRSRWKSCRRSQGEPTSRLAGHRTRDSGQLDQLEEPLIHYLAHGCFSKASHPLSHWETFSQNLSNSIKVTSWVPRTRNQSIPSSTGVRKQKQGSQGQLLFTGAKKFIDNIFLTFNFLHLLQLLLSSPQLWSNNSTGCQMMCDIAVTKIVYLHAIEQLFRTRNRANKLSRAPDCHQNS